jgi:hypothetical protein
LAREIARDVLGNPDVGLLPTLDSDHRRLFWRVYRSALFENLSEEFGASRALARFTVGSVRRARGLVARAITADAGAAPASVH